MDYSSTAIKKKNIDDNVIDTFNIIDMIAENNNDDNELKEKKNNENMFQREMIVDKFNDDDDFKLNTNNPYNDIETKMNMIENEKKSNKRKKNCNNRTINTKSNKRPNTELFDKSNKRMRLLKQQLSCKQKHDRNIQKFYENMKISNNPQIIYTLSSKKNESFTYTNKLLLYKRDSISYLDMKNRMQKIIFSSLYLLKIFIKNMYFHNIQENHHLGDELSTGLMKKLFKNISKLAIKGYKNNGKKKNEIKQKLIEILDQSHSNDTNSTETNIKLEKPLTLPGGTSQTIEWDIMNFLSIYFSHTLSVGYIMILKQYIMKFINDNDILSYISHNVFDMVKEEFDINTLTNLILLSIVYPDRKQIYHFYEYDTICNFISRERKRYIFVSNKDKTLNQRKLDTHLIFKNAHRYLEYINEMRIALKLSQDDITNIIFKTIDIDIDNHNSNFFENKTHMHISIGFTLNCYIN
nr:MAG: hypothetical protein [Metapenaeopsis lamellata majanivirus]